jgi:hypothetical protein
MDTRHEPAQSCCSHGAVRQAQAQDRKADGGSSRDRRRKATGKKRHTSRTPSLSPSPSSAAAAAASRSSPAADASINGWRGVDSSTVFMSYSVAKGCTAAAMLRLVDEGRLDWSQPIDQIWPELACGYNTTNIAGDAGAGGGGAAGGGAISMAEAASHRLGLPGTPLPPMRFYRRYLEGGWRGLWDEGIAWAEATPTVWRPGERASYCHLGWSFVVGGLIERKCNEHIADTVQRVASAVGLPHCLHIGRLPQRLWHKSATLEPPPAGHNSVWASALGQPLSVGWRMLGTIESFLFRRAGVKRHFSQLPTCIENR